MSILMPLRTTTADEAQSHGLKHNKHFEGMTHIPWEWYTGKVIVITRVHWKMGDLV